MDGASIINQSYYVGIDQGTEQLKIALFRADGKLISLAGHPYHTRYPYNGWAVQNPLDWWDALKIALRSCIKKSSVSPNNIKAIGIAATSATVLCVNQEGEPLDDAIIWMDIRSRREAEDIERTGHPVLKYSGGSDSEEWMVPKALWLKRNRNSIYVQSSKVIESLDWLVFKLTGKWTASLSNTTNSWNYVPAMGGWVEEFFREIGLEDITSKWPNTVLPIGYPVGHLTEKAARELGMCTDTIVVEGAIDAHMSMIGMNGVNKGRLAITIGTSIAHLLLSDEPIFAKGLWGPYQSAIIKDLWLTEGGQTSGAILLKWLCDNLCSSKTERNKFFKKYNELARKLPPGSDGVIALDTWQGNRTPWRDPLMRGALWGLSLKHTTANIYRATLEGITYGTRSIVETMVSNGGEITEMVISGGGAKNIFWLQMFSDVCRLPVLIPKINETAVFGAAIAAAVGSRHYDTIQEACEHMVGSYHIIEPQEETSKKYDYFYNKYKETYQALKKLMHEMGSTLNR